MGALPRGNPAADTVRYRGDEDRHLPRNWVTEKSGRRTGAGQRQAIVAALVKTQNAA